MPPNAAARRRAESKGQAMKGGRFPIRNAGDLHKAIRAIGRATGPSGKHSESERRKVRRFVIRRARALKLTNRIPSSWNADGSLS